MKYELTFKDNLTDAEAELVRAYWAGKLPACVTWLVKSRRTPAVRVRVPRYMLVSPTPR